jgi:hypothetical protein
LSARSLSSTRRTRSTSPGIDSWGIGQADQEREMEVGVALASQ